MTESLLSALRRNVAFNAFHDSEARYPQPNVMEGTREGILEKLSNWIEDPFKKSRIHWAHGAAGTGKSAVAQALSEKYLGTGQLAAAFFFSRNDSTRDKLDPLVASLAHQLHTCKALEPHITHHLQQSISSLPNILAKK